MSEPPGGNLWVVVPVYNESSVLTNLIPAILKESKNAVFVDDGSTDDTFLTLKKFPVHIIHHPANLGQGAALRSGIQFALKQGAEFIITMDADGQMNPADIPRMLEPLVSNQCDIVLGNRFGSGLNDSSDVPFSRRCLLRLGSVAIRMAWNLKLTDSQNGFRAMTRHAAKKIRIQHDRMAHALEILHQIKKNHLRVIEIPVKINYSPYSLDKGQKTFGVFKILWELMRSFFHRHTNDK